MVPHYGLNHYEKVADSSEVIADSALPRPYTVHILIKETVIVLRDTITWLDMPGTMAQTSSANPVIEHDLGKVSCSAAGRTGTNIPLTLDPKPNYLTIGHDSCVSTGITRLAVFCH